MLHNKLYRLSRSQRITLTILAVLFLVLSLIWFFLELYQIPFPMEPLVVFNGGIATLLATFWPWRPSNKSRRKKSLIAFDYTTNNGEFCIGSNECVFTLKFSKASDTSIYVYNYPQDIEAIAKIHETRNISEVRDVRCFDYSSRSYSIEEGGLFALKNIYGNYAIVCIQDVRDSDRQDKFDEVVFSYVINSPKCTDFS